MAKNYALISSFLGTLLHHGGKSPSWVVLDNASAHKAKGLKVFLESLKDKLELNYSAPLYAPDLNVMERWWKFTSKECTHNTYYPTFMGIIESLATHINKYTEPNEVISTLCAIPWCALVVRIIRVRNRCLLCLAKKEAPT